VEPVYWNSEFLEFLGPGISIYPNRGKAKGELADSHDSAYATSIVSILGHL
jgi:hypothetical protein